MSIMMERYMKRAGISTPMGRILRESSARTDAMKAYKAAIAYLKSGSIPHKEVNTDKGMYIDLPGKSQDQIEDIVDQIKRHISHSEGMWLDAESDGISIRDPDYD